MLQEQHSLDPTDAQTLDQLYASMQAACRTMAGYPLNYRFDYSKLYRFMGLHINNVGDPYLPSNYRINSHAIEREVLETFRVLTRATPETFWGYVTNGGTEGNMYGIFLGRELYPDGIVYYSEDAHYSVGKILRLLHARSIMIRSRPDGEIDYEDLRETIKIHRDVPPIIFANIGTTMKGAVDNVRAIRQILKDLAISRAYIHGDAALSGMILPFVDEPQAFTFADGVDSLSISGHKMIGSPIPCGVALARREYVNRIAREVEYVGILDTTITGSRNGHSPLFLWYALKTLGHAGFRAMVQQCLETADYAIARLQDIGVPAWRHKNSITVVFPRPADWVIKKWQIAPHQGVGHIITMPQVTRGLVDALMDDISAARGSAAEEQAHAADHHHY